MKSQTEISWLFFVAHSVFMFNFWAIVCKTVRRPMLLDRCPVLPVCLSVTLVYCGQTVGWMKLKLGMQVGMTQATSC